MDYEAIEVGQTLATLDKGVITTAHIMRWSAAVENWHRIHYDQTFAKEHDKLPDVLINGSWKQHVLVQLVKDVLGPRGWLWRLKFRYRRMDVARDAIRAEAIVLAKQQIDGFGFLTLQIRLLNQAQAVSTSGHAIGVLPVRGGAEVPYPFVPTPGCAVLQFPQDD
ncbi:MAG: MaoC family dehydratase [Lautropia sp.]